VSAAKFITYIELERKFKYFKVPFVEEQQVILLMRKASVISLDKYQKIRRIILYLSPYFF